MTTGLGFSDEVDGDEFELRKLRRAAWLAQQNAEGDPDDSGVLTRWLALLAAGWSVVDAFDRDGRRYLVARQHQSRVAPRRALSKREREVAILASLGHANKQIAYELGISIASVGTYLLRLKEKLGFRSRLDLVGMLKSGMQ